MPVGSKCWPGHESLRRDCGRTSWRSGPEPPDPFFGVNFLLAPPEAGNKDTVSVQHFLDRFREELGLSSGETDLALPPSSLSKQLEIVFEERVPVLGVALGEPGDLVEQAHAKGMLVTSIVTSVEEAVLVAEVERTS